jgi:hypothetical protein
MSDNIISIGDEVEVIGGQLHGFGGRVVCVTRCYVKFTNDAGILYQRKLCSLVTVTFFAWSMPGNPKR